MIESLDKRCVICDQPITSRQYQDPATVRACAPGCAQALAAREHPDLAHTRKIEANGLLDGEGR